MAELESIQILRRDLESQGKSLVLTNGCFDLLHVGHVRYLQQARALGDALVVAVNSDASVRQLKGSGRPLNPACDRIELLEALSCVDAAVEFADLRATSIIRALCPHHYAKGGDYTLDSLNSEEREALEECGAEIHLLALIPGKSTSGILKRQNSATKRIGVLGSGRGTNFDAIIAAIERGELQAEIALVLSDVVDAPILEKARNKGIEAVYVNPGPYRTKLHQSAQKEIRDRLVAAGVDLVVLAGFMRMIKSPLLDDFAGRIVNVHPSLLPKFKGLEAWKQALDAGECETGTTVHLVTEEMDAGKILAQAKVPICKGDTPESLHARIQVEEHRIFPKTIAALLENL